MEKKLNGFNNGRDTTDGIGGKTPLRCDKVEPHPITFTDAVKKETHGLDLDRIASKKNAVFEALEQEKHSYAARFAEWIGLEDYVVVSESDLNVFWSKRTESVSKTSSQLLSLFNEHEAKQDKIEKK